MDALLNLGPLSGHTRVLILAGDRDTTVGTIGASQLVTQLAASGFPYADVRFETVHSHGAFIADHFSVLSDTRRAAGVLGPDRSLPGAAGPSKLTPPRAGVAELADAPGLGPVGSVLGGSTPLARIDHERARRARNYGNTLSRSSSGSRSFSGGLSSVFFRSRSGLGWLR